MHQEAYDAAEGLRRSDLWLIHKSPAHFKAAMDTPETEPSASLIFGIAVHKYILEPDTFSDEYEIAPKVDKRTKAGKEEWAKFTEKCETENKEPLDEATFAVIKQMAEAVKSNPLAVELLTGKHETEWYWEDPLTGEKVKAKCDNITVYDGKQYIVDYKTTDSCEDGHFERSVKKYGYQFQAGFYTSGVSINTGENYGFAFVAQEKKPPFACRVYLCSDEFVKQGQLQYHELLNRYHTCKITNNWWGYEGDTPKPTMLLDDSERFASKTNKSINLHSFRSDSYLDDDYEEPEEDWSDV